VALLCDELKTMCIVQCGVSGHLAQSL
jgi:hypothetical protein